MSPRLVIPIALATASCVYFNAMYDARRQYAEGMELRRTGSDGAAELHFDSVIANTEGILEDHADSKYAAEAALLKARSELEKRLYDAARGTAAALPELTDDPKKIATSRGLEGVAVRELAAVEGDPAALSRSIELLAEALEGDIDDEDRASFRFHLGVALLAAGEAAAAAEELAAVRGDVELDARIRQDLARGLYDAGQREASLEVVDQLLRESRFANFQVGMRDLLDSLTRYDPVAVEQLLGAQLDQPEVPEAKRSLLILLRGRALELAADTAGAIALYATLGPATGPDAAHARYRHALLLVRHGRTPEDIVEAKALLDLALAGTGPRLHAEVDRVQRRVAEFSHLVDAYETRGSTAAEAALRAAEIAGFDLAAPRVSRGLYLKYLELAPLSPWRAKAMAGALLHRDTPAGDWAGDRGETTDAELRAALDDLPAGDPYRVAIADLPRTSEIDSAYVVAESDLRRRLVEIRMLYDTTAAFLAPGDSVREVAPEPDEAEGDAAEAF